MTSIRDDLRLFAALAVIIVALIFIWILISGSIDEHKRWVAWCEEQGGRVITDDNTNLGFDSDGNIIYTSNTQYWCINQSGGIIDIR